MNVQVKPALKWIVLYREDAREGKWMVHRHHAYDTPYRFNHIEGCGGVIRVLRRQGKHAVAVREDRAHSVYGIVV